MRRQLGGLVLTSLVVALAGCEPSVVTPSPTATAQSPTSEPRPSSSPAQPTPAPTPAFAVDPRYGYVAGGVWTETGVAVVPPARVAGTSRDGASMAVWSVTSDQRDQLQVIDLISRQSRSFFTLSATERGGDVTWAPDGHALAAVGLSNAALGGAGEANLTLYSAVHIVDLTTGAEHEVMKASKAGRILAWQFDGDVAFGALRVGGTALVSELVHVDGSAETRQIDDVCTAESASSAEYILTLSPSCGNLAEPGSATEPPSVVRVSHLKNRADDWMAVPASHEYVLAVHRRPTTGDLGVLVREADTKSFRLELWADLGRGARTVVARFDGGRPLTLGDVDLLFRVDGTAAIVSLRNSTGSTDSRLVDIATGQSAALSTHERPTAAVVLDPGVAARVRGDPLGLQPKTLAYYRNEVLGYRINLPGVYRYSERLELYRLAREPGAVLDTPHDVFTARTEADEAAVARPCETICPIFDYTATVTLWRNPTNITPVAWASDTLLAGGSSSKVVDVQTFGLVHAARVRNGARFELAFYVAVPGGMLEIGFENFHTPPPPGAMLDLLQTVMPSFTLL